MTDPKDVPSVMFGPLPTKLLYVEDDDDLRDMIAGAFVHAGFDVTAVPSAEAALDLLHASRYDIVVTDYNLVHETGAWLLQKAETKGYLKSTAAIVLTAEQYPKGVDGYKVLRKPVDFATLLNAIADAVGTVSPIAPHPPLVTLGAPPPAELELILYVTSDSQESQKAIRNLHRALKPYDPSRFRLTIFDVAHGGDEEWYETLEEDRIIVTPTLVRKRPGPKTWIVGTLAPNEALVQLLASALGDRERG